MPTDTATTIIKTVNKSHYHRRLCWAWRLTPAVRRDADLIILYKGGTASQLNANSWNNNGNGPKTSAQSGMYIVDDDIGGAALLADVVIIVDGQTKARLRHLLLILPRAEIPSISAYVTINTIDTNVGRHMPVFRRIDRCVTGGGVYSDTAKAFCSGRRAARSSLTRPLFWYGILFRRSPHYAGAKYQARGISYVQA